MTAETNGGNAMPSLENVNGENDAGRPPLLRRRGWLIFVIVPLLVMAYASVTERIERWKAAALFAEPRLDDIYVASMGEVPGSGFERHELIQGGGKFYGLLALVRLEPDGMVFITSMSANQDKGKMLKELERDPDRFEFDLGNPLFLDKAEAQRLWEKRVLLNVRRYPAGKIGAAARFDARDDDGEREGEGEEQTPRPGVLEVALAI